MSFWLAPVPGMPVSPKHLAHNTPELLSGVSGTGSGVSLGCLLQDRVIQRDISHQSLQPDILLLEFLESPGLLYSHAAVLSAPAVVGMVGHAKLSAGFGNRTALAQQNLSFPQLADDCSAVNVLLGIQMPPFLPVQL